MVKMSYEKLVEECKRLRLKGERAVAEFFAVSKGNDQGSKKVHGSAAAGCSGARLTLCDVLAPDRSTCQRPCTRRCSAHTTRCCWMHGSMCVPFACATGRLCQVTYSSTAQVILPEQGLLEKHEQLDNVLAMIPDEDVRQTLAERFKVRVRWHVLQPRSSEMARRAVWQAVRANAGGRCGAAVGGAGKGG